MNMYILMGAPGQGKTPWCKKFIGGGDSGNKSRRCFIFDINNEYGSRTKYPGQYAYCLSTNSNDQRARYIGDDIKRFTEIAMKKTNTVVVMEEATAFFRGRQVGLTSRMIINRRHTGNVYLFLFHSINRVPPEIMEMADYCILFKTNDEDHTVRRKYSRIYESYEKLKTMPDGSFETIKLI